MRKYGLTVLSGLLLVMLVSSVSAIPPTDEVIARWIAEGVWEQKVANWQAFKKAGGCSPVEHSVFDKEKHRQDLALGVQTTDTVRVIVILVDFSDWPSDSQSVAGTKEDFDSILFSDSTIDAIYNPTGSMTDFYLENSYDQFYIKGDIYGWYQMPQTYQFYENDDNGMTLGPQLAADAVDAAGLDPEVDFSKYDLDSNGICDGVIIIHSGPGAEEAGSDHIWSHKSSINPAKYYDGVSISDYTMNPEESGNELSPIGVFCHEYGHFIGLPDLYDITTNSRSGLGKWSLMASGSYNGDSKRPAHFDAWCKDQVGFLDLIEVTTNHFHDTIPAVEYNPVAYKFSNGWSQGQYWVVENRQPYTSDATLPGWGLCIYHVDSAAPANNADYTRYFVAMEQADGLNQLAAAIMNRGDGGDPWPGSSDAREFHNLTNPNTMTNAVTPVDDPDVTRIAVWRISDSDSLMTADFDITDYSRPYVSLARTDGILLYDSIAVIDDPPGGNGNGVMEAGETIQFYCGVKNQMRESFNIHATLETDNPGVTFLSNNVAFGSDLFGLPRDNAAAPIEFRLADSLIPTIDSFYLTITTDSLESTPGSGEFSFHFGLELSLGAPQVLIVDDDRGDSYETEIENAFYRLRIPTRTWIKQTQGSPSGTDLMTYPYVFWHTGEAATGVLNNSDIAAMKMFMDNSGNLLLSTASGVDDMDALDPAFLADYFHATYNGNSFLYFKWAGVDGHPVSEGTVYQRISPPPDLTPTHLLEPVNGGVVAFTLPSPNTSMICGITYTDVHSSILLTFPVEMLRDDYSTDPKDTLLLRALEFFGGITTSVYDGRPFGEMPRNFDLHQNYPNPFNPSTHITYTLRATGGGGQVPSRTNLSIYNVLGRHVRTLVDEIQIPGQHVVTWDGTDRFHRPVATGVYFYRLRRGEDVETKKMILLK
ncbi:MAG: M6 family metalloprotease domain-containing protein [bacterium]